MLHAKSSNILINMFFLLQKYRGAKTLAWAAHYASGRRPPARSVALRGERAVMGSLRANAKSDILQEVSL
jgi:hypothetical protein